MGGTAAKLARAGRSILFVRVVFSGDQTTLLDKYSTEDRYVGSLAGEPYAEALKARSPLRADSPDVFAKSRFG